MNGEWIKIKIDKETHSSNVPWGVELLVTDGKRVKYLERHGWDKEEYYFDCGLGKEEGITHFFIFPEPPKEPEYENT